MDFTGLTLGRAMRLARKDADFDVEYTAMTWEVSPNTIYNWETDRTLPSRSQVGDWERRFQCPGLMALYPVSGKRLVKGAGTLGYSLRKARVVAGLRQGDLALKMGRTGATISNWESGRSRPSEEDIHKLNELLHVNLSREEGASSYRGFADQMEEKAKTGQAMNRREQVLMVWWDMISRMGLDTLEEKLLGVSGYLNDDIAETIARTRGITGMW
jgi:transcriptional regulator with XRE-family HTH domain